MQHIHIAKAKIVGSEKYPNVIGHVSFTDAPLGVWIAAEIRHLPKTKAEFYGFHLHETGECEPKIEPYFDFTGRHYNPDKTGHPMHAGDFPNILATKRGYAKLFFLTDRFKVADVVNKSVVIHLNADDYKTQPSGDAGIKIACGKILPALRI